MDGCSYIQSINTATLQWNLKKELKKMYCKIKILIFYIVQRWHYFSRSSMTSSSLMLYLVLRIQNISKTLDPILPHQEWGCFGHITNSYECHLGLSSIPILKTTTKNHKIQSFLLGFQLPLRLLRDEQHFQWAEHHIAAQNPGSWCMLMIPAAHILWNGEP